MIDRVNPPTVASSLLLLCCPGYSDSLPLIVITSCTPFLATACSVQNFSRISMDNSRGKCLKGRRYGEGVLDPGRFDEGFSNIGSQSDIPSISRR
ncbi:hypothetical protein KC19_VG189800 [Ceratodon purpureus]|uniref:Uncharacterized protein n=1 Tax=Ceratodon purpureus TaxID=3225 RepID=A0A8T0HRL8_CERPU|nr:hypothetical protein KC19_VG189800 [Ceratodon purpureus]